MSNRAWVTLATNDSYGLGALVLAHSLRRANSTYSAVVLITPSVTEPMRDRLRAVFSEVIVVDVLDSRDAAHLALLQRPELGITFTKIHCWNLVQYEKCVFLDADTLVIQNCDELFEREELSAAPDVGWPDCFNSGVFVFRPSEETFNNLVKFASERGSFDGGDQGLLNSFFSDWAHGDINKHLPFLYNVTSAAFYSYIPALKHYGQNLKIIHFIGAVKPWLQQYDWRSRSVEAPEHLRQFLQLWWDLFVSQVHAQLHTNMDEGYVGEQETMVLHRDIIEQDVSYEPVSQKHIDLGYYKPLLDTQSEFPWHHPENQISEPEVNAQKIDISQFYDPWDIYSGNIPPSRYSRQAEQTESYEDTRKYAWDYVAPQHSQHQSQFTHNYDQPSYHSYQESSQSHYSYREPYHNHNSHQEYTWQGNSESSQNIYQHSEYTPSVTQSQYSCNEDSHSKHLHDFGHHHHHGATPSHHSYSHHMTSTQHSHSHDTTSTLHSYNVNEQHSTHNHYGPSHHSQEQYENNYFQEEKHERENPNSYEIHTQHHSRPQCIVQNEVTEKHNNPDNFTYVQLKNKNKIEQIYTVMMDHIKLRSETLNEEENEYDSDIDVYEDIRPRHPYDGFYLRHITTIDTRGRKICTHEIPYAPRSPSPTSSDEYEDALEYLPEDVYVDTVNCEDLQTGVAGNLARVIPGAPAQQEAVDELARRQGWEAGNIDYMGADSFDNIWAKISQTLSQPPAPEPESRAPQNEENSESNKPAEIPLKEEESLVEKQSAPEVLAKNTADEPESITETPVVMPTPCELEKPEPVVEAAVPPASVEATTAPAPAEPIPASEPAKAATVPAHSEAATAPAPAEALTAPEPAKAATVPAPAEALTSPEPAKAATVLAPAEAITSPEPAKAATAPAPAEAVTVPAPAEAVTSPEPAKAATAPSPAETVTVPAPVEAVTSPEPAKAATAPAPAEAVTAPALAEATVAHSPAEATAASTPAESAVAPSSVESVAAPVPGESEVAPSPAESAVAPAPVEAAVVLLPAEVAVALGEATTGFSATEVPVPAKNIEILIPVSETATEEALPVFAKAADVEAISESSAAEEKAEPVQEIPVAVIEALKIDEMAPEPKESGKADEPASEAASHEPIPAVVQSILEDSGDFGASDSPPLVHTPSKEEVARAPPAKSEERRRPAGKLQLRPPVVDPLPTPDSEQEDAAALAHAIVASELRTPTVTSPTPPALSPASPVSLSQIGVKPKPSIAAQIESSVPKAPKAETDAPKKKIIRKVVKKDASGESTASAPVPPPRKKEKKPKEK